MRIYAHGVVANRKADGSPVTAADKAGEDVPLAALASTAASQSLSRKMLPSHGISPPDRFFLVDPLDGEGVSAPRWAGRLYHQYCADRTGQAGHGY